VSKSVISKVEFPADLADDSLKFVQGQLQRANVGLGLLA